MKNDIIEILMRRDHISRKEATEMLFTCREDIDRAFEEGNYYKVDDIIMNDLGIEPDYLYDILNV